VIADEYVDPTFGTGVVKITPAHDPNDYATGLRNNLPMINLLNPDGTYNENAGPYAGLDRREVRKRVVADLEAQGLLAKVEPYTNRVGLSDRSKTPIEPYLSDQWFVRMGDDPAGKPGFAQQAMDAVTSSAVSIRPERYAKSYLDWLREKRDWCISRQLWWGHRIPIWHATDATEDELKTAFAGRDDVTYAPSETGGWLICSLGDLPADALGDSHLLTQDPDVLDTWFSSALWPHSTLGWPEHTPELKKYYPTSVLSTARDIITLWVARMVIFGQYNAGDVPFRDVYIHPVIQDGNGKRMSKSAGNGIDPVDIIDLYGADTLRYTLASLATETQDLRMPVDKAKLPDGRQVNTSERFEQGRTFPNKLWNASRFALMNLEGYTPAPIDWATLPPEDRWILGGIQTLATDVTADLDAFQFADATRKLRDFTWNEFCDWYIEFIKARLRNPETRPVAQRVLATVLDVLCRLLHPIMPFVTEEVWQALNAVAPVRGMRDTDPAAESVCIAPWPRGLGAEIEPDEEAALAVESWREVIQALRNLRAEREVKKDVAIRPTLVSSGITADRLNRGLEHIRMLTNAAEITIVESAEVPADAAVSILSEVEIILPLAGLIDTEAEQARQRKALLDLDRQINPLRAKLANSNFLDRAPADVVDAQRAKLSDLESQRSAVAALLAE
jgi:valyl-tRNA synthetase